METLLSQSILGLNSQTPNPNNHTKPNIASPSSKIFIKFHQELSSKAKHSQYATHEDYLFPTNTITSCLKNKVPSNNNVLTHSNIHAPITSRLDTFTWLKK